MSDFFVDDTLFTIAVFDRGIIVTDKMRLNKLNCERRFADSATSDHNQLILFVSIPRFGHILKSTKATTDNRKKFQGEYSGGVNLYNFKEWNTTLGGGDNSWHIIGTQFLRYKQSLSVCCDDILFKSNFRKI